MTTAIPTSARRGLSYSQEVALLAALRLATPEPPHGLARELHSRWPAEPSEREALAIALRRDVIDEPAAISRHPDWTSRQRARWPAPVRTVAGPEAAVSTPMGRAARPIVSGRHRGALTRELGGLALLASAERERVEGLVTRRALALMARLLGRRERLAVLSALGEAEASLLREVDRDESTLPVVVVESLRAGFTRAAARAASPDELLERFGLFVLAHALGRPFRVEARALAEVRPHRPGRRLVKAWRRARRAPHRLNEAIRDLALAVITAATSSTPSDEAST